MGGAAGRLRMMAGAALAAAVVTTLLLPSPGAAAPRDGQKFQDWVIRCPERPREHGGAVEDQGEAGRAPPPCFMLQSAVLKDRNQRVLAFAVARPQGRPRPVAILTVPLGIRLVPGIELSVDGGPARRLVVERCLATGCRTTFPLDEKLLARLRRGLRAEVRIRDAAGRTLALPVSLKGFTAAFRALGAP